MSAPTQIPALLSTSSHTNANKWAEGNSRQAAKEGEQKRQQPVTRDKEEETLRDALLRQRLKEIVEFAEADPLYGVSREEAMRQAAEKYGRPAGEKKGGKR